MYDIDDLPTYAEQVEATNKQIEQATIYQYHRRLNLPKGAIVLLARPLPKPSKLARIWPVLINWTFWFVLICLGLFATTWLMSLF